MKKISGFLSMIVLGLAACEKNVTINVPEQSPKLVINGLNIKDSSIRVGIGKSRYILKPLSNSGNNMDEFLVKDAQVVLYENNIAIDTMVYQAAIQGYKSPHNKVIRAGYTYTIKASAPGYVPVEASTMLPSQSVITSVTHIPNARKDSYGDFMDEIRIKINDPAGEQNFYQVQILSTSFGSGSGYPVNCVSTTDKDIEAIGYTDPLGNDNCIDGSSLLMKDVNFNGGEKQVTFYVNSYELQTYSNGTGRDYRPYIRVNRITEDYFKFVRSYNIYNNAVDNPFAEPVNVYTNVKNGYGIFAGYTSAVDTLR
jgi:hypothetical protein